MQNMGYYADQDHLRSSRSVSIESSYANTISSSFCKGASGVLHPLGQTHWFLLFQRRELCRPCTVF